MDKLKDLEELFRHQLKDLYSAETQLAEALPEIRKHAASQKLQNILMDHIKETKEHKKRLTDIAKTVDFDLSGRTCEAMKGLIKETRSFSSAEADAMVMDAGLIANIQRIESYEISAYGSALQYAKRLKHDVAIEKLRQTQNEEKDVDQQLTVLAEETINPQAEKA